MVVKEHRHNVTISPSPPLPPHLAFRYVREDLCEKLHIAIGQDCHEMWVRQERKKSAIANAEKEKRRMAAARLSVAANLHSDPSTGP